MANFEKALEKVLKHEGGYVNDPDDRGGETYKGISRNNFPEWGGWGHLATHSFGDPELDSDLSALVSEFYKEEFWDKMYLDRITPEKVSAEIFDTAVNIGIKKSSTFLQQALNVLNREERLFDDLKVDGHIGAKTVSSVNLLNANGGGFTLLKVLNILQGAYYIDIMTANPVMEKYARGWLKRVNIGKEG